MKKDRITKNFIRFRKKEKFKHFIKLPTLIWTILFLIISVFVLWGSYLVYEKCVWLSGVLVSVGCGIITGIVMYILSNIRNNKILRLKQEQNALSAVYNRISEVHFLKSKNDKQMAALLGIELTFREDCLRVRDIFDELGKSVSYLPHTFFKTKEEASQLLEKIHSLEIRYDFLESENEVEFEEWFDQCIEVLLPLSDRLYSLANEKCDQLLFMEKYVV